MSTYVAIALGFALMGFADRVQQMKLSKRQSSTSKGRRLTTAFSSKRTSAHANQAITITLGQATWTIGDVATRDLRNYTMTSQSLPVEREHQRRTRCATLELAASCALGNLLRIALAHSEVLGDLAKSDLSGREEVRAVASHGLRDLLQSLGLVKGDLLLDQGLGRLVESTGLKENASREGHHDENTKNDQEGGRTFFLPD